MEEIKIKRMKIGNNIIYIEEKENYIGFYFQVENYSIIEFMCGFNPINFLNDDKKIEKFILDNYRDWYDNYSDSINSLEE